jgi:hypothetical protein
MCRARCMFHERNTVDASCAPCSCAGLVLLLLMFKKRILQEAAAGQHSHGEELRGATELCYTSWVGQIRLVVVKIEDKSLSSAATGCIFHIQ